jgi:hypothetical protein
VIALFQTICVQETKIKMLICTYCNNAVAPNSLATLTARDVIKPSCAFDRETGNVLESAELSRKEMERYIRQDVGETDPVLWRQLTERMRKAVSEAERERECLSELDMHL